MDVELFEEDDDWFYESIRRYKTLQMFDLENQPQHVIQTHSDQLCVASWSQKRSTSELLKLKLPKKLTLPEDEEGRCKANDFKVLCGVYSGNNVLQLDYVRSFDKIITSEKRSKGFHFYDFKVSSDGSSGIQNINVDVESPNFAFQEALLLIAFTVKNSLHLLTLSSEQEAQEIQLPFLSQNVLKCEFVNAHQVLVLDTGSGVVVSCDTRSKTAEVLSDVKTKTNQTWTLSNVCENGYYYGLLSNTGQCLVYDLRHSEATETQIPSGTQNAKLKMSFSSDNRFSVSGYNDNVGVYSFQGWEVANIFTHNGHTKLSRGSKESLVTDHIWVPNIGPNFILSICDNNSLNCWEYTRERVL